ncbi:MAG: hypothetical protein RR782_07610 [Clostridium sp.]
MKSCLNCRYYKDYECYSEDFNRVIGSDVVGEEAEVYDYGIDTGVFICEPREFYCCYWE